MAGTKVFFGLGVVLVGLGVLQSTSELERLRARVDRLQREVGICCGTEELPVPAGTLAKDLEFVVKLRKDVEEMRLRLEKLEQVCEQR